MDQNASPPSKQNQGRTCRVSNRLLIGLFCMIALILAVAGILFYNQQSKAIRSQKTNDLNSIAELKISQLAQWRQERLTDARAYAASLAIDQAFAQWMAAPDDVVSKTQVVSALQSLMNLKGYRNVMVATAAGSLLLSLDPDLTTLEPETQALVTQASQSAQSGVPVLGDFFSSPGGNQTYLDVAVAVLDASAAPKAVLVLRVDPINYLYPLIESWPTPSQSAETLLVEKEGSDGVYLNPLRFQFSKPLSLRIPLTQVNIPAVQAVLGRTGEFQGYDYRGVQVLSEIMQVPGTHWVMIAKVDVAEIFSEINSVGVGVVLFVVLTVLMTALVAAYTFNVRQTRLYQTLFQAEHKLRAAQEETRTTLYSIGDGVITTDQDGRVTRLNPVAESLTGWSEADAQGKPLAQVFNIINEISRSEVENPAGRVMADGVVVGLANHTLLIDRAGAEHPIVDSGAPIRDHDGKIIGVVLVFRDQTQERASQRERALLNYVISASLNEIFMIDVDTLRFRFVNAGALMNLGYSLEQLKEMTPADITPSFSFERFKNTMRPLIDHKIPELVHETVQQRANGSLYPIEVHLQLFEYEGERVILALTKDITERKKAQQSLQENEARLEKAQAIAHVGNWEINLADKTIWGSPEAFRIYGLERTTPYMTLLQVQQIPLPQDRPRLDAALDGLIRRQTTYDLEYRIQRDSDGAIRTINSTADLEINENGAPEKVVGVILDITERKLADQAMLESEERYRSIFENNHTVMMLIDPDTGAIISANPAACAFYGWSFDELVQMRMSQINTLSEAEIYQEMQLAREGQRNSFLFKHRKKNGEESDVEIFSGPLVLKGKTVLFSIVHDITERKRAETQVAEQLAELHRWYTATLGREKRILELKAEINELLAGAGLPPRYASSEKATANG